MFSGTSSDFMEKFNYHACNFLMKTFLGDETEKLEERERERERGRRRGNDRTKERGREGQGGGVSKT